MTVNAHHHLYSALYRHLPGPARPPRDFPEILELVWWRLDQAVTLADIAAGTRLAAVEALASGCTAIVDHHESPNAIEGSLDVVAEACAEVGVRVDCAYGVTDRHGPAGAAAGLAENERFLRAGGRGHVGVHAAFTCTDDTLAAAAGLAADLGVGVHVHVAEGAVDAGAPDRLRHLSRDDWLLVHGVHLADDHGLLGTIVHNPRSNRGNGVGEAKPERFTNPVALGTDGIDSDMAAEAEAAGPHGPAWLANNLALFPEAAGDVVTDDAVVVEGEVVWKGGTSTRVDVEEIRAKAAEHGAALARRW